MQNSFNVLTLKFRNYWTVLFSKHIFYHIQSSTTPAQKFFLLLISTEVNIELILALETHFSLRIIVKNILSPKREKGSRHSMMLFDICFIHYSILLLPLYTFLELHVIISHVWSNLFVSFLVDTTTLSANTIFC